jgi:Domain of unknown function (DUF4218)
MVKTRSHPEGSIAEGYILYESLTYCSRYLDCGKKVNHIDHSADIMNDNSSTEMLYLRRTGCPFLGSCVIELDNVSWIQAHRYVLVNYDHIEPFVEYDLILYIQNFSFKVIHISHAGLMYMQKAPCFSLIEQAIKKARCKTYSP